MPERPHGVVAPGVPSDTFDNLLRARVARWRPCVRVYHSDAGTAVKRQMPFFCFKKGP